MNFLKSYLGLFIVIVLSLFSILPLLQSGFFPMHDDTQVARVFEMGKMLKDGVFPVRWVPDLGYGYGYPIFNFYAPLAYYAGGFFTLLGFDALTSTKIMMILGILLSGIFMYLLAREFWGEIGGAVSGLFYVYAPYHAVDIYVRGDVGESWAYAFIPLMFWGFYKVLKVSGGDSNLNDSPSRSHFATPRRWRGNDLDSFEVDVENVWKWVLVGSVGYAGVILSHNLTALMVTPFLIIAILLFCYIAYKKKNLLTTYNLLLTTILGLMLSAFYWIPALLEMRYTNVLSQIGGGADFRDHFVCVGQLWESSWGFGGSIPGCIDGMSFRIGKLHTLFVFVALFLLLLRHCEERQRRSNPTLRLLLPDKSGLAMTGSMRLAIVILCIVGFGVSIFFILEISKPIWELLKPMEFFQYPWRFLLLASFFSSLLSGFVVWFLSITTSTSKESRSLPRHLRGVSNVYFNTVPYLSGMTLVFLLIFFNAKLFQPQTILPKTSSDYTNEYALKWTASKISDEFLPPNFKKPKSEREIAKGPAIPPQETLVQKISNAISFGGIAILTLGIIITYRKKRLSV